MTTVIDRRQRKKIAIRAQILSAGIDLFSRRGIDGVTIDQIAEAADIGKGTIYNYFSTKEDIVVAFMVDLEARLATRISRFKPANLPVDRILTRYILLHFRLKQPYHAFVRVFLATMFSDTGHFTPYMLEIQKYTDPPLRSLFTALQQRNLLREGADVSEFINSFKIIHLGLTALWAVEGPPFLQTARTVRQQMYFFCEGIERKTS